MCQSFFKQSDYSSEGGWSSASGWYIVKNVFEVVNKTKIIQVFLIWKESTTSVFLVQNSHLIKCVTCSYFVTICEIYYNLLWNSFYSENVSK